MNVLLVLCVLLLACFGHGFFWVGLVNRIHAWAGPRWIIDFTTLLCVLFFMGLPFLAGYSIWIHRPENWGSGAWSEFSTATLLKQCATTPNGFGAIYGNLCAIGGTVLLLCRLIDTRRVNPKGTLVDYRKETLDLTESSKETLLLGPSARLFNLVPGNQVLKISIERKQLVINGLDPALEGFTLAHISDLHMTGRIGLELYRRVAAQLQELHPDLIALTGDIIENASCRPWIAETMNNLHAKYGHYFILGNHDAFVDARETCSQLTGLGWHHAGDRWLEVDGDRGPILIGGNSLPWFSPPADKSTPPICVSNSCHVGRGPLDREPLRLVLTHSPDQIGWACKQGADLALAGHTHGGQICFPLLGPVACPSLYGTRYVGGVYQVDSTVMHVTRGVSGVTPIRWNCPPEIAILELSGSVVGVRS